MFVLFNYQWTIFTHQLRHLGKMADFFKQNNAETYFHEILVNKDGRYFLFMELETSIFNSLS